MKRFSDARKSISHTHYSRTIKNFHANKMKGKRPKIRTSLEVMIAVEFHNKSINLSKTSKTIKSIMINNDWDNLGGL